MPEERAFGAAVIAVLIGIVGFFLVISGIFVLLVGLFSLSWGVLNSNTFLPWATANHTLAGAVIIILGLVYIGIALGLYRQHFWALIVMFVFGVLYLVGETSGIVYDLFLRKPTLPLTNTDILGSIVALVVVVVVLAYLAAVRDDFI